MAFEVGKRVVPISKAMVIRHRKSRRLLRAVAVCCPSDLAGLRELGQAGGDISGIEVQRLSEVTGGAPRVPSEELDDARVGVGLTVARRGAPIARAPRSRTPHRASRSGLGVAFRTFGWELNSGVRFVGMWHR